MHPCCACCHPDDGAPAQRTAFHLLSKVDISKKRKSLHNLRLGQTVIEEGASDGNSSQGGRCITRAVGANRTRGGKRERRHCPATQVHAAIVGRSEERRVGKECR